MIVVDRLGTDFEVKLETMAEEHPNSRYKYSRLREILSDVVKVIDSNRKANQLQQKLTSFQFI